MRRALVLLGGAMVLAGCGGSSDTEGVPNRWPLEGGEDELRQLSSTFGPRLKSSKAEAYDFHRGIDIPTPEGTDVVAVAAGVVQRAGNDPAFSDIGVQIEHRKPGHSDCAAGGCFYSRYIHLSEALVSAGDHVDRGDTIATSGVGENGFPHLHFEVRDGDNQQKSCAHPLSFLPDPGWTPFTVTLGKIDSATTPGKVSVEVTVLVPGFNPDIVRVEVSTTDRSSGKALDQRVFDYVEWNRDHTPEGNPDLINDPDLDGIHVEPAQFHPASSGCAVLFRFDGLAGPANASDLEVSARAADVHGKVVAAGQR